MSGVEQGVEHHRAQGREFDPDAFATDIRQGFDPGLGEDHIGAVRDIHDQHHAQVHPLTEQGDDLVQGQHAGIEHAIAQVQHHVRRGGQLHQLDLTGIQPAQAACQIHGLVARPLIAAHLERMLWAVAAGQQ